MKKRLIAAGLATGLSVVSFAGVAGASSHQGGCPKGDGWFLAPTFFVIEEIDNGNFKDQNGDGLACAKVNPGEGEGVMGTWTWKDNTNPVVP